jgi:hypothetical protein
VIKGEYDESGDLGKVASKSRAGQKPMFKPPPLTVQSVRGRARGAIGT